MSEQKIISHTSFICFITAAFGIDWWRWQCTGFKVEWILGFLRKPTFKFLFKVLLISFGRQFFHWGLIHVVPYIHICWIISSICWWWWSFCLWAAEHYQPTGCLLFDSCSCCSRGFVTSLRLPSAPDSLEINGLHVYLISIKLTHTSGQSRAYLPFVRWRKSRPGITAC